MMKLKDILSLSRSRHQVQATSKKNTLELIAQTVAQDFPHIKSNDVFDALIQREKLGSTGIGHGVALPHCRLTNAGQAIAVLLLLQEAINYDSLDKQPVDLILALIIPEESADEHLQLLSILAEKLSNLEFREQLRHSQDKQELYQIFIR